MKTKNGFILLNRSEFKNWMMKTNINRKITMIHNHHTFIPDYTHFQQRDHFTLVQGMKDFHVNEKRWSDIGQQITTFPDGKIIIGTRSFESGPACIRHNNTEAICIEHVGNFNKGKDKMTEEHRKTIIHVNAVLNLKFKTKPSTDINVYHHWFDLSTGQRKNGGGISKSCPGTGFFGGNKVDDAKRNLIPSVLKELKSFPEFEETFGEPPNEDPIGLAMVMRANQLNIRTGPGTRFKRVGALNRGNIVDVYQKKGRWTRISTEKRWVSSFFLKSIQAGIITDPDPKGLSVRTGPSVRFRKVKSLFKDTPVIIFETSDNNWHRISFLDMWVSGKFVKITSPNTEG